jgi:hypothetical protein
VIKMRRRRKKKTTVRGEVSKGLKDIFKEMVRQINTPIKKRRR